MNYEFPRIMTIEDVLPVVQGTKEFIVGERDGFTVIDYMMMGNDTFPSLTPAGGSALDRFLKTEEAKIRRECRGLLFDQNGTIISRPLHKFFNLGERPELAHDMLDMSQPHRILNKADGSMVRPFYLGEGIRWGTRMGVTTVSMQAEVFVAQNRRYIDFADFCLRMGKTPIFEWMSRQNRVVIDHPVDNMVLLAIRDMVTGAYTSYNLMEQTANHFGVPVIESVGGLGKDPREIAEVVSNFEDREGIVIRFDDGHMVKVKSDWYLTVHRSRSYVERERNIVTAVVTGALDDVKPLLVEDDLARVLEVEEKWTKLLISAAEQIDTHISKFKGDRKAFALADHGRLTMWKPSMFRVWSGENSLAAVTGQVSAQLSTEKKFDAFKESIDNIA